MPKLAVVTLIHSTADCATPSVAATLQKPAFCGVTVKVVPLAGEIEATAVAPVPHVAGSNVAENVLPYGALDQPGSAAVNCCVDGASLKNTVG